MVPPLNPGHPFKKDHAVSYRLEVRPYNVRELCDLYRVSYKTFNVWIEPFKDEIGEFRGKMYTVIQVEIIFSRLGVPFMLEEGLP